eukprot:Nitzschia sp. Nitz4//scaffold23_size168460//18812//19372//NITZ4_002204-RA/size168460-processed-gene-0.211-mRNA-1//1//CDS//3329543590//1159//frame0
MVAESKRFYFTNGEVVKRNDPYAILGLEWGAGATTAEIKQAFRRKAQLLHPDVNQADSPEEALQKFQKLQSAYESLMKSIVGPDALDMEEWRVANWQRADRIAVDRTDVAGVARKRPMQPVSTKNYGRELGHPSGAGNKPKAEFLGQRKRTSSVGRGQSKWVTPKEWKPWNAEDQHNNRAHRPPSK